MDAILSLFEFTNHEIGFVFGRFGLELLVIVLVIYLVALIILSLTKKKTQEIGFTNWFKVCIMFGIDTAIIALGVITILTLRFNGLHYFAASALSWSWFCGYLLMLPEFLFMAGLVACYVVLNNQIYKSIK